MVAGVAFGVTTDDAAVAVAKRLLAADEAEERAGFGRDLAGEMAAGPGTGLS